MENDFRYLKLPLISTTWRNSIEKISRANISKNNSSHDCISVLKSILLFAFKYQFLFMFAPMF